MKQIKAIVVILFLLLVVILAVQNYKALSTPISFRANLLFINAESAGLPVFLIAVVAFLTGVIITWFYGVSERLGFKRQIKALMKDVNEKEKELNSLRNLPVTTEDMKTGEAPSTEDHTS